MISSIYPIFVPRIKPWLHFMWPRKEMRMLSLYIQEEGCTALHAAAEQGNAEAVHLLNKFSLARDVKDKVSYM